VRGGKPFERNSVFVRIAGVDRVYKKIRIEEKPIAHFALRE
jgi:hypothetical protein